MPRRLALRGTPERLPDRSSRVARARLRASPRRRARPPAHQPRRTTGARPSSCPTMQPTIRTRAGQREPSAVIRRRGARGAGEAIRGSPSPRASRSRSSRPRRRPRSERSSAICSSEYFVTAAPASQITSTTKTHRDRRAPAHAGRVACDRAARASSTTSRARTTSLEFLGYRFAFGAGDFEERVTAAAVKLGLVEANDLDEDETLDLVELAADGRDRRAAQRARALPVRHWERVVAARGRVARLLAAEAGLPRRLPRPPRQGGAARGVVGRRRSGDFGYAEPGGRPRPARARPDARGAGTLELQARCRARASLRRHGRAARRRDEKPSRCSALGDADPDLADRAERHDQLLRLPSSQCGQSVRKPKPGSADSDREPVERPVRQLDADRRLLDAVLGRESVDAAVDPLDELLEPARPSPVSRAQRLRTGSRRRAPRRRARGRAR